MLFSYDKAKGATQGFRNGFGVGGISLGDIGANKKTLDTGNNRKFLETLEYAQQKNKIPEGKFDAFVETEAKILGDVDEKMVKLAKDTQTTQGSIIGLTKTFENQTSVTGKLSTSLKSIGGTLLATLGNAAISMAVSTAISLFIKGVQDFINSTEQLAQKTQEISDKFNSQKTTLSDYSNQIVSLKAVLDDETASTQEVQAATSQLYEIQNDLIGQYGSYHTGIDLINGDLESQLDLLQQINQENAQRALNDINAEKSNRVKGTNLLAKYFETAFLPGVGQGVLITDFFNNYFGKNQGFKKSVGNTLFESDVLGNDVGSKLFGTSSAQIKTMVEDYNESFETTNQTVLRLAKNYKDAFEVNGNTITAKGNINDVNDAVVKLQLQLQALGVEDEKVFSSLSSIASETSDRMSVYGESYNTIIEGEIQNSKDLSEYYKSLTDKYNEFIQAQSSGDTDAVERIGKEYQELFANISQSDTDKKYIDYFRNLYPELQNYISQWEFDVKIKASLEGQSSVQEEFQKLSDWGLDEYEDQITSGKLTKFGNIDMDKRAIIEWSDELKKTYQDELASWDHYNPEVGTIDTVYGGSMGFNWDNQEHQIAFSPILQTDDGAVFLGKDQVIKYIDSVISQAAEDGNITADEILEIDAEGTGYQVGNNYVQGLIAGIDDNSGIAAEKIGMLMHFSGKYGAINLARNESSGLEILSSDLQRNSAEEIWSRYLYYQAAIEGGADVNKQAVAEYTALEEAATNAGLGILDYINAVKSIPEYSDEMQHLRELMGENFTEEFGETLSDADLEALVAIKPKEDGLEYTQEEISKLLSPIEVGIKPVINSTDAVEGLDKLESTFGGLNDIYGTTVTNAEVATANDIQSVNTGFGGVTFNETDIANVNALSNALEAYDDALVESKGDAGEAQKATDKLVTAYIDQSEILDDLTEENKDYYIERLKANGVTNAAEVVESRLSEEVKRTSDNLKNLSKVIAQNRENLDKGAAAGEDYTNAVEAISDNVKALLFTDADGKELIPNVNPEFITNNLDDIYKAVEGDIDALNRLRVEAAKEIAAHIDITSDNPQEVLDEVNALINAYPIDDIKVGTYLNGTPLIEGLNDLVKAGKITQNSMNSILSSIGVTPEISYEKAQVTGSMINDVQQKITASTGDRSLDKTHSQLKQMQAKLRSQYKMEMQIPTIKYKATGGGAAAKYSAPSAPKSSGGGGGGGGNGGGGGGSSSASEPNKPQQEAEDTFDWIEVAIQRIEEEINRLDEVVNNSYTTWAKRNTALVKELDKTKKEIQAQFIAQQEYQHYLKTIKINNGKGLNADDYGENDQLVKQRDQKLLDEAKRLWATGQYQKKIQNGQMTGNDIEKIQNHFLVDAINEYKEYYQKAVEAGDAVETLKIKLGELARTNFDNVAKQFEETQQYFESTADLIDERINRTEEKGYFVSRKYYDNLITNETKNINSLKSEYSKLVAARDDAVKNAYITKGSEEWHSMNQEILNVASSIESATTELVKFNNEIRQLSWDVFDYTRDRIEKVTDEFEFLIDLLDNQKLYDDYGMFNSRGWADTALHASKYNTYMQQALDYANERAKIEKELAKDKANKNLIERREELIQLQQESIKNSYAEKEAIRDLVQEAINIHLSKLSELIDEYKKAMHDARDLYNYQKNITEQTKNISNIQKQLEAYQGDDSEETRATIQKLQDNLRKAQEQLQETEWDKYISETETFLSDMYDEYEETLNARLDDIDLLVHDLIDDINARGTEIKDIISQVSDEVAYNLTSSANTVLNNGTIVSDFKTSFETYATTTQAMINDIRNYISGIGNQTVAEAINTGNIQSAPAAKSTPVNTTNIAYKNNNSMEVASKNNSTNVATTTSSSSTKSSTPNYHTMTSRVQLASTVRDGIDWSPVFDVNYYKNRYPDLQKAFGNNYAAYLDHFLNYGMKEGRQASDTFDVKYYKNKYPDLQKAYGNNLGQYYRHFIIYGIKEGRQGSATFNVQTYKKLYGDLQKAYGNNLKQYYSHYNLWGAGENRKHYATGTSHASNEIAWTNEGALYGKGGEVIYRKSDGAILTPLHNGDKVFTAQMSDNLWNLAKLNLKPTSVPTGTAVKTVNNVNEISITLPNVSNYDEFKTQLKNDPNMANFIQEITLGEVSTGVKLNKRKL